LILACKSRATIKVPFNFNRVLIGYCDSFSDIRHGFDSSRYQQLALNVVQYPATIALDSPLIALQNSVFSDFSFIFLSAERNNPGTRGSMTWQTNNTYIVRKYFPQTVLMALSQSAALLSLNHERTTCHVTRSRQIIKITQMLF
jgi:hypothetical protein